MKKYLLIITFVLTAIAAKAQIQADPAHWAFGLKKIAGNTYEVHLRCTIDPTWHIYAQKQTTDFIGTATQITFNKAPGMQLIGIPAEIGKKNTWTDKTVGVTNYEYDGTVDFVQKVSLSPDINEIKCSITYQTCTHTHCLSPTSVNFTIPVNH